MKLFALLLLLSLPAVADPYSSYTNSRYGFRVAVPKGFVPQPEAPSLDGRNFRSADGAIITIFGSNNVTNRTVDSELQDLLRMRVKKPLARARGKNWFTLSWLEKGQLVSVKTYVGKGCLDCLILHYPLAAKAHYHGLKRTLEASFQPGDLSTFH
jgi:hypothetical protein